MTDAVNDDENRNSDSDQDAETTPEMLPRPLLHVGQYFKVGKQQDAVKVHQSYIQTADIATYFYIDNLYDFDRREMLKFVVRNTNATTAMNALVKLQRRKAENIADSMLLPKWETAHDGDGTIAEAMEEGSKIWRNEMQLLSNLTKLWSYCAYEWTARVWMSKMTR